LAESLRVRQMCFAPSKFDLSVLPRGDIDYRANDLDTPNAIHLSLADDTQIFGSTVSH
jgi:hypothetical protein